MAKNKFYAVELKDGRKNILTSWDDAQAFIATCPSSARYKGFAKRDDAEAFLAGTSNATSDAVQPSGLPTETVPGKTAIAYVDGSFNADTGTWGSGVLFMDAANLDEKKPLSKSGTVFAEHRNVTGEVYAAIMAVKYALDAGYQAIVIYHDYTGIAEWANGSWKTNEEMTQKYAGWMAKQKDRIVISFMKVKGHSGVEDNETVDRLAKAACGVK